MIDEIVEGVTDTLEMLAYFIGVAFGLAIILGLFTILYKFSIFFYYIFFPVAR